ncbi:MAG: ECF RNA polymerase sigma factor SigR [Phycisphaerae bacterium]|nr:ECF RNA polymerase sigma factor SigR [Phycisphaerae bacterium]
MSHRADRKQQFLQLLRPHQASLDRYALRHAWDRQGAADIVQEAVLTAWREFERFTVGTDFKAWMFRVLINTLYTYNKRTRRDQQRITRLAEEEIGPPSPTSAPWESVLTQTQQVFEQLDDRLVEALLTLTEVERHCLLLRWLEDYSYREIADLLQIPSGTVMSHVHRARLKLRERLGSLAAELNLLAEPTR